MFAIRPVVACFAGAGITGSHLDQPLQPEADLDTQHGPWRLADLLRYNRCALNIDGGCGRIERKKNREGRPTSPRDGTALHADTSSVLFDDRSGDPQSSPVPTSCFVVKNGSKMCFRVCAAMPCPESMMVRRAPGLPGPRRCLAAEIRTFTEPPTSTASMLLLRRFATTWRISPECSRRQGPARSEH